MKIDFSLLKPRLGFIVNNYFLFLSAGFHGQIDKILVAPILGFVVLGNFSLGMQFIAVMSIFSGMIFKYLLAQDASNVENNRLKFYSVICSVIISLLGIVFLPMIIEVLFPKYIIVINAIQIMSIHIIPYSIAVIFESKLLGALKTKYVLVGRFTGLGVMIIGMITFGSVFDIVGIAISLILSSITLCIIFMIGIKKLAVEAR